MEIHTQMLERVGGDAGVAAVAAECLERLAASDVFGRLAGVERPALKAALAGLAIHALGGEPPEPGVGAAIAPLVPDVGAFEALATLLGECLAANGAPEAAIVNVGPALSAALETRATVHMAGETAGKAAAKVAPAAPKPQDAFEAMVEQAPFGVLRVDPALTVRYMNPAALEAFRAFEAALGLKAETLLGQSLEVLFDRPAQARAILTNPQQLPHVLTVRVGEDILELSASALTGPDGDFAGALVTWKRATARAKLLGELSEVVARLEGLMVTLAASPDLLAD